MGHCLVPEVLALWVWREILCRQVDVEAKHVGFLQSLFPCSIWFNAFCLGFTFWYRFVSSHYSWNLSIRLGCIRQECAEITDEGVEVFEAVAEVSGGKSNIISTKNQTQRQDCQMVYEKMDYTDHQEIQDDRLLLPVVTLLFRYLSRLTWISTTRRSYHDIARFFGSFQVKFLSSSLVAILKTVTTFTSTEISASGPT